MKIRNDIKIALSYLKGYKALAFATIVVLIFLFLSEGMGIGMIIPILQEIGGEESANIFTKYAKLLLNFIHISYNFLNLIILFGLVMLAKYSLLALQQNLARTLSASVMHDFRKKAFENLMDLPLSYYYKTKTGNMVATINTSSQNASGMIEMVVLAFTELIFCIVYLALAFIISVPITMLICLITSITYIFVVPRFKKAHSWGRRGKSIIDDISSFLVDKLGGIKIIKSFNNEKFHLKRFDRLISDYKQFAISIQNNRIIASLLLEWPLLVLVVALLIFSVQVLHLAIAPLITLLYVFQALIPRINSINNKYLQVRELLPHFSKVEDIISRENKTYLTQGQRSFKTFESNIRFDNVWFKYVDTEGYALKNINLAIEKNKTTAFVGTSGGGKTTLVDLVLRQHDPGRGTIKVDTVDLREIKRSNWHNIVSIVDQDNYLFHDTIYNNILYGNLVGEGKDVIGAAKLANAHDFISNLPDKYETVVGERGIKLSGGQKQRIALARALIRNPQILVLDEATSALDSESEKLIQDSIGKLSKSKTIIIIAHRLSTIAHADKIVVIENGEILEEGTAEVLLKKNGIFKRYHSLQAGERT